MEKGRIYSIFALIFGTYLLITGLSSLLALSGISLEFLRSVFILLIPLAFMLSLWSFFNIIFFIYLLIKKRHSSLILPGLFGLYSIFTYLPLFGLLTAGVTNLIILSILSLAIFYFSLRRFRKNNGKNKK